MGAQHMRRVVLAVLGVVVGLAAVVAGVYLVAGIGVALIVAGAPTVAACLFLVPTDSTDERTAP